MTVRRVVVIALGVVGVVVTVAVGVMVWSTHSPWPGAMVIRYAFNRMGSQTSTKLEAHAPTGVTVIADQPYLPGDDQALLDVYLPAAADAPLPVVIWTHGGAWLAGDKTVPRGYLELIAAAGYVVVAPNYSLAPEHVYPAPIRDLNSAYSYVVANAGRFKADVNDIVLAGDSAGAQLSAEMAALITSPDYAREVGIAPALHAQQVKAVVLACGIYQLEKLSQHGPNLPVVFGWGDHVVLWSYSGTQDFTEPVIRQMSPYYHVGKAFPPAFITGGNADPLTDRQSKPLADELESAGVTVTRLFYPPGHTPRLPHEYQFNLDNADGQNALEQIEHFLAAHTARAQ